MHSGKRACNLWIGGQWGQRDGIDACKYDKGFHWPGWTLAKRGPKGDRIRYAKKPFCVGRGGLQG